MDNSDLLVADLRARAERYCARAERCPMQVRQKLYMWGADDSARAKVMAHLESEGYLDTERFCRAYVHDHYMINRWSAEKIRAGLYRLGLPSADISAALSGIDEQREE